MSKPTHHHHPVRFFFFIARLAMLSFCCCFSLFSRPNLWSGLSSLFHHQRNPSSGSVISRIHHYYCPCLNWLRRFFSSSFFLQGEAWRHMFFLCKGIQGCACSKASMHKSSPSLLPRHVCSQCLFCCLTNSFLSCLALSHTVFSSSSLSLEKEAKSVCLLSIELTISLGRQGEAQAIGINSPH